jgi:hypothetical protein
MQKMIYQLQMQRAEGRMYRKRAERLDCGRIPPLWVLFTTQLLSTPI